MKKCFVHIVAVICCLIAVIAQAQEQWVDSVKNAALYQKEDTNKVWTLITLCNFYAFAYPDTALQYGRQAHDLSEKLNFDNGRLFSIISINAALYSMGNYSQELENALKLIPLAKRMNSIYATGFSSGAVGDSYANLGEFAAAMPYYKKVLQIGIENKLPELHRMYSMLSPVFIGLKQYDSALFYAQKGYALFKTSSYYSSNDWEMKWSQSGVYVTLADAYAINDMNDSALKYYRMSIPPSEWTNMKYNWIDACNGMAGVFKKQHQPDSALMYSKKILADTNLTTFPAGKQQAAEIIAAIYEESHSADSALKYLHLSIKIKDSLHSHQKMMAFQNILLKKNENEHAVELATSSVQNRYRLYLLLVVFIVGSLAAFMIIRNRRIKQLQNIRNSIADDLHDDIGSTLSSISIMNELAKAKSPEALQLLTSIGESTAAIQENMSDIVWTVNPHNDHFENLLQRMYLFATEITEAKNIQLTFNSDAALHNIKLTMKQRKNIYLFFKEAINNAAKHSGAKKITVTVSRKESNIEMNITDDGKGFKTGESYNGNGMSSLKRRAEELNAAYAISSEINNGTKAALTFKIT
ncbi:MAG: hypothetical protein KF746_17335 [Chitinophagaceae bacterium]|nr:hypothetical protein [Chitinophagaceae bacterium]